MMPLYPMTFEPILQERVWGGDRLQRLFGRSGDPERRIGESWEISDRPGAESVISNGAFRGRTLRSLMETEGDRLMGRGKVLGGRFPWLGKLLDAQDDLSLQVHPSVASSRMWGGEPKTEMWYVAAAEKDAKVYAGLKRGVSRADFERNLEAGTVAECFHVLPVCPGDVLFLPSGRVHALGKGLVIFEIQQNSDTTYRVFDWNRVGLDGQPRSLHIQEGLSSIDFDDIEPVLVSSAFERADGGDCRVLVRHSLFWIDHVRVGAALRDVRPAGTPGLWVVVRGGLEIDAVGVEDSTVVKPGDFCLLPAEVKVRGVRVIPGTEVLRVSLPEAEAESEVEVEFG